MIDMCEVTSTGRAKELLRTLEEGVEALEASEVQRSYAGAAGR
jgi:hypothetical protein